MAREITIFKNTFRFVYRRQGRGGTFEPNILVSRRGPNGSVSGYGPKMFPKVLGILAPYYDKEMHHRYQRRPMCWWNRTHYLVIVLPHIPFHWAYRLRRVGGLWLYRVNNHLYYPEYR